MAQGKRAGSPDVAPKIRGAFKRALLRLEQRGKPLSGMIEQHLESDFLGTLKVIAQFTPREVENTIEHKRSTEDFTDDELLEIIAGAGGGVGDDEAEGPEALH